MSKLITLFSIVAIFTCPSTLYGQGELLLSPSKGEKMPFSESLAEFVSGRIIRQDHTSVDGVPVNSSVIWIPTYYGYHSFMGVLNSYVHFHTTLTSLRTWRMAENNFYVIQLGGNNISVRIVYDSHESILMLSLPPGY